MTKEGNSALHAEHLDIPGAYNNEILRLSPHDIPMRFLSNESLSP